MSQCVGGCGLAPEPGDIYYGGCRDAAGRDREHAVFESRHEDGLT